MEKSSDIKKIILVTGKYSRFCFFLKKDLKKFKTYFTSKNNFNLLNFNQMKKFIKNKKITHLIHVAGLSRPMDLHEKDINLSIDLNIIGTANIVKLCNLFKIKLVYFSTNYVYPGKTGNYKETSKLLPFNNYAWSKLGGETSVHLYKNSLILRLCMTDFPFTHKKAIKGATTSFVFNKDVSKIIPFLLDEFGIINVGGKRKDIYEFAKKYNNKIKSINYTKIKNFPKDSSLNSQKLLTILKKKKLRLKNFEY
jgi:dTDP-4-dehydrorhamnose reductase